MLTVVFIAVAILVVVLAVTRMAASRRRLHDYDENPDSYTPDDSYGGPPA